MVCKLKLREEVKKQSSTFISKCKVWKLREPDIQKKFCDAVQARSVNRGTSGRDDAGTGGRNVEGMWNDLKQCLVEGANEVCGRTKGRPVHKETWWWNDEVARVVEDKRMLYMKWKKSKKEGHSEQAAKAELAYAAAKRLSKKAIGKAKEAERKKLGECLDMEDGKEKLFRAVKQMVRNNQDVAGGGGCLKDTDGKIVVEEERVKEIWRKHFDKLANEEFDWDRNSLQPESLVSGPIKEVTEQEVKRAMQKMKSGKAAGPSGVVAEMLGAAGEEGVRWMTELFNTIVLEGKIPTDWSKSWIVGIYKGKGDAMECGSYRGIKLLEHTMKVFERVMESRIRDRVDIDEMQFGFRPGKGTTDAIFIVRQVQEKYLAKKKDLWMAFVDLERHLIGCRDRCYGGQ
jgi:hypothetical protein